MHALSPVRIGRNAAIFVLVMGSIVGGLAGRALAATGAPSGLPGLTGSTLTVGPALIDITVDPGATYDAPVTLVNGSANAVTITAEVDAVPTPDGQQGEVAPSFDAGSWFTLDRDALELAAQSQTTVNVTIKVPADAEPGGHYATVFFGSTPIGGSTGDVAVNTRVGMVGLITVNGEVRRSLALDQTLSAPRFALAPGATAFTTSLSNEGTIHVAPQYRLVVDGWWQGEVASLDGPNATLLPGLTQPLTISWNRGWWPDRYQARMELLGADLGQSATSAYLYVIPWPWLLLPFLVLVITMVVVRYRRQKRRIRRARNRRLARQVLGGVRKPKD